MKSKHSHSISALLAVLLALGILAYGTAYAQSYENKYVHALAPLMLPQSNVGSALQQAAFQQPDLLVVYGSSEMLNETTQYRAFQFFQYYPTGFDVYEVAKSGATSLDIAQDLAAIGSELRGKKVVFSFTPTMFNALEVSPLAYAANFSLLHANALIFDLYLSLETKQTAAQRMNDYPDTLDDDPVLLFAVQQLACKCWYGPSLYALSLPLGQINTWIIRLQDHWEVLNDIWSIPNLNPQVVRKPEQINWSRQIVQALMAEKRHSNNNPYGIDNGLWKWSYKRKLRFPKKPGSANSQFLQNLDDSKEWTDFDLVLQILKEMGAQPLILSRPIDGPVWNAMGVSRPARLVYYAKLQSAISPYGFPFVDFANHDGDHYFSIDLSSHTSREGWAYVDQTLNAFFHGQIY
ncbi:MAG: D-alanyl-lipoteichoic acid biosynthesis protein DltD [Anaerolineales bacterium]